MQLSIQIYSLVISFVFGGIFSLELMLFHKYYLKVIPVLKLILSFLLIMLNALIYFILLYFVNNGILHLYFFIVMIFGAYLFPKMINFVFTLFRKK